VLSTGNNPGRGKLGGVSLAGGGPSGKGTGRRDGVWGGGGVDGRVMGLEDIGVIVHTKTRESMGVLPKNLFKKLAST